MKNLVFLTIMIAGILLKFCTNSKDIVPEESMDTTTTEIVRTGKMVSQLLHGFNTENLYFHYRGEQAAKDLIKGLGPKVLRFPGGTPANVYHINEPGYGYNKAEADLIEKKSGPSKNALKCVRLDSEQNNAKSQNSNYASDFAMLLKEIDAQVLLVANLLGSNEDVLDMVKFFHDEGITIAGIELGNEYYLSEYRDVFPSVTDYISKAKGLSSEIRVMYPDIPLAVTAAPNDIMKKLGMRQKLMSSSWNEALNEQDFFDAVIIHMYSKNRDCDELSQTGRFDCYLDHNTNYVGDDVRSSLKDISATYSGRPIWLTEWNLKDVFKGLGNTFLQSIYYADYAMEMARTSEVEMATYHNLLNGGTGHNLIGKNKQKTSAQSPSHVQRAVYPIAEMYQSIYDGKHEIVNLPELGLDPDKIGLSAFENENDLVLILVNRGKASLTLTGLQLMDLMPSNDIQVHSVIGSSLYDSSFTIEQQEAQDDKSALKVNIPALSVNKILIAKK